MDRATNSFLLPRVRFLNTLTLLRCTDSRRFEIDIYHPLPPNRVRPDGAAPFLLNASGEVVTTQARPDWFCRVQKGNGDLCDSKAEFANYQSLRDQVAVQHVKPGLEGVLLHNNKRCHRCNPAIGPDARRRRKARNSRPRDAGPNLAAEAVAQNVLQHVQAALNTRNGLSGNKAQAQTQIFLAAVTPQGGIGLDEMQAWTADTIPATGSAAAQMAELVAGHVAAKGAQDGGDGNAAQDVVLQ